MSLAFFFLGFHVSAVATKIKVEVFWTLGIYKCYGIVGFGLVVMVSCGMVW